MDASTLPNSVGAPARDAFPPDPCIPTVEVFANANGKTQFDVPTVNCAITNAYLRLETEGAGAFAADHGGSTSADGFKSGPAE